MGSLDDMLATVKIDFKEHELQKGQIVDAAYIRSLAGLDDGNAVVMLYDGGLGKVEVAMHENIQVHILAGMHFHCSDHRSLEEQMRLYMAGGSRRKVDPEFEEYMAKLRDECEAADLT